MPRLISFFNAWFATMPILVDSALLIRPDFVIPLIFKDPPLPDTNTELLDIALKGFAIRDICMGINTWAAIYYGNRRVIGWGLLAGSLVAFVDGYALYKNLGRGLVDHWSFLPVLWFYGVKQAFY
jgi:hypothetical protein